MASWRRPAGLCFSRKSQGSADALEMERRGVGDRRPIAPEARTVFMFSAGARPRGAWEELLAIARKARSLLARSARPRGAGRSCRAGRGSNNAGRRCRPAPCEITWTLRPRMSPSWRSSASRSALAIFAALRALARAMSMPSPGRDFSRRTHSSVCRTERSLAMISRASWSGSSAVATARAWPILISPRDSDSRTNCGSSSNLNRLAT